MEAVAAIVAALTKPNPATPAIQSISKWKWDQ
jgi:hypothetical protein